MGEKNNSLSSFFGYTVPRNVMERWLFTILEDPLYIGFADDRCIREFLEELGYTCEIQTLKRQNSVLSDDKSVSDDDNEDEAKEK